MRKHPALAVAVLGMTLAGCSQRPAFAPPSEESLPNDAYGQTVRYGKQLVLQTGVYAKPYVGSALSCGNCHLDAGRRPHSAPFVGVVATYPQYRSRDARVDTLEDRINDCFRRSLNGKPLPPDSREMRALVTYMTWLSKGVPIGAKVEGMGFKRLRPPKPPNPTVGKQIFAQTCATCHGPEGQGHGRYPPLWGPRSFNLGAGMARLGTAAAFIQANMPFGHGNTLSEQQAYDVAAFVLSHPRPDFPDQARDWPQGGKPKDTPY